MNHDAKTKFSLLLQSCKRYITEHKLDVQTFNTDINSVQYDLDDLIIFMRMKVKPIIEDREQIMNLVYSQNIKIDKVHEDKLYRYACALCVLL